MFPYEYILNFDYRQIELDRFLATLKIHEVFTHEFLGWKEIDLTQVYLNYDYDYIQQLV